MNVKISNQIGNYDGRAVPYIELEVLGDKHTLSVRKYPKNVSVVMWKNSDKNGTKVSLKMPHDKFDFTTHVSDMVCNFSTEIELDVMNILEEKWDYATKVNNF